VRSITGDARRGFRNTHTTNAVQRALTLQANAKKISGRGRGILASDESNATTGKRLDTIGLVS
jgi:Fructose-bisphosphate aldolase class-I